MNSACGYRPFDRREMTTPTSIADAMASDIFAAALRSPGDATPVDLREFGWSADQIAGFSAVAHDRAATRLAALQGAAS